MKTLLTFAFVLLVVSAKAQSPVYANFPSSDFLRYGNNLTVNTNKFLKTDRGEGTNNNFYESVGFYDAQTGTGTDGFLWAPNPGNRTMFASGSVSNFIIRNASFQIRPVAGSSFNIQEWQNSGGTALAYVDSTGGFNGSGLGLTSLDAMSLINTVPTARLGSGTANNTTYLRGDSTWQPISGISGTGTNQFYIAGTTAAIGFGGIPNSTWLATWGTNSFGTILGGIGPGGTMQFRNLAGTDLTITLNNLTGTVTASNVFVTNGITAGTITNAGKILWIGTGVAPIGISNGVNGGNIIGAQGGLTNWAAQNYVSSSGTFKSSGSQLISLLNNSDAGIYLYTGFGGDGRLLFAGSAANTDGRAYINNDSLMLKSTYSLSWSANRPGFESPDFNVSRLGASSGAIGNGTAGNASGSLSLSNITVGSRITIPSGANARAGTTTLVNGTITVNNTTVTANTLVICNVKTAGGTRVAGSLSWSVSAATSFTISAVDLTGVVSALDTSVVSYLLIENP